MTTLTISTKPAPAIDSPLSRLWATNWPLTLMSLASLALFAIAAIMAVIDPRLITGAPAWVKPMKFAISTVIYSLTLVWMLGYIKGHPRLVALVGSVTAIGFVIELALIVMQVIRGVRSHFNIDTAFDATVFSVMGSTIMIVFLMNLITAGLLVRQKFTDAVFGSSLRLGLLISAVGMGVAFLMTSMPSPAQLAVLQAGQKPQYFGGHSVGVEDGGAGLPFVGWSTEGGDLRIAHFVGLHGLQVLPVLGMLINRFFAALTNRRRMALVWTAGLGYLGLISLLTWQALRGQSIVGPDALTLGSFAILALGILGLGIGIVRSARTA